jgi:tellurite resistance protein TerC
MHSVGTPLLWAGFFVLVTVMLALDLGVFHRSAHEVKMKEALGWSALWIALSLVFGGVVYKAVSPEMGLQFIAGWLIEKALSVDNLFVMLVIFDAFAVPKVYRHKVLFWGILGAVVMRAIFIFAGAALIAKFRPLMYLFGALLIWTGGKLFVTREAEPHPEENRAFRFFQRIVPATHEYRGSAFIIFEQGRRLATPLLLVLILVEITDLIFAVDSIPAVFGISTDPFIVFTSNIFAILGLRALFFVVSNAMGGFRFLSVGLALVLVFVGAKMIAAEWPLHFHVPTPWSLAVIGAVLFLAIVASLIYPKREEPGGGRAEDGGTAKGH